MAIKPKTSRAVHANRGVEVWYRNKLSDLISEMHDSITMHVQASYKRKEPTIGFAQDDVDPTVDLQRTMKKYGDLWRKKLNKMSLDLASQFTKKNFKSSQASMLASFKDAGFTVKFKPTKRSISAFRAVVSENVNLINSIPDQYLKDVQSVVWENVMKGGDLNALSSGLQKKYRITAKRADLIARDQNNKAKAIIENARRREIGITEAIWQHSAGGKEPRKTHVAMSGKRFNLKKGMYDSAVGKFIWPGTEINCRCVSQAVIPGLE